MALFNHASLLALGLAACAGHIACAQNLPSGLAALTELSVGGAQLALDSNGGLFRSKDRGEHWRPVKRQWAGKAVELVGIPALTTAKPDATATTYVAVLLRTTTALHWVSVDRGKTWKPSTLDDVRRNDVKWSGN
jgi:hypothetical protein